MKTIYLVSGGTGFVGNNVIRQLICRGAQVRTLIRDSEKASRVFADIYSGNDSNSNLEYIIGDVRDEAALRKLFRESDNCEYVFIHTAAIVDIAGIEFNQKMYDVNVNGTKAVLKICKEKKEIFSSSNRLPYG